jgi:hypothetical protein
LENHQYNVVSIELTKEERKKTRNYVQRVKTQRLRWYNDDEIVRSSPWETKLVQSQKFRIKDIYIYTHTNNTIQMKQIKAQFLLEYNIIN